jgi:hypothetical protein
VKEGRLCRKEGYEERKVMKEGYEGRKDGRKVVKEKNSGGREGREEVKERRKVMKEGSEGSKGRKEEGRRRKEGQKKKGGRKGGRKEGGTDSLAISSGMGTVEGFRPSLHYVLPFIPSPPCFRRWFLHFHPCFLSSSLTSMCSSFLPHLSSFTPFFLSLPTQNGAPSFPFLHRRPSFIPSFLPSATW